MEEVGEKNLYGQVDGRRQLSGTKTRRSRISRKFFASLFLGNGWSLRSANRNSAEAKCVLAWTSITKQTDEAAESMKASDGAMTSGQSAASSAHQDGGNKKNNMPPIGSANNMPIGPKLPSMEFRNLTLDSLVALPFLEGRDPLFHPPKRQVAGPLAEQDVWHEGETLAPRTFSRTEDDGVLASRAMTKVARYNPERTVWSSLNRLVRKVSVECNDEIVERVARTSQRHIVNRSFGRCRKQSWSVLAKNTRESGPLIAATAVVQVSKDR